VLPPPIESAQYTSAGFGALCEQLGVTQSMGATGVCWDNAAAESFFGTLKRELANRRRWATRADARRDLMRWIEGWFNTRRLHSTLDYHSPLEIEDLGPHLTSRDGVRVLSDHS
jgi:putative transposase